MKKRQKARLMLIAGMSAILLIIILVIVLLIVKGNKKLETLTLTPTFAETELNVNSDYSFMITANPDGAKLKKMEFSVDDETALFEASGSSTESAVLHTGAEGTLTVYVKQGDVVSNYLSFSVVDLAAKAEEEARAQAEAQAQAEQAALEAQVAQEAEINAKEYIKAIDTPRVRTSPNTDNNDNIIGKLAIGDVFERLDDSDGWSHIKFRDQDAYVSDDYVQVITEEEYQTALTENANKPEEKPQENNNNNTANNTTDNNTATQTQAQAQPQQPAVDAAQAAANEQAIAEAQAAAAAAAAAAAQAAAGTVINCKDGACLVTPSQLQTIHATWDFAGDAVEMAGHHTIGELEAVIGPVTRR